MIHTGMWYGSPPAEVLPHLRVGQTIQVEIIQLTQIVGWCVDGEWLVRKTDEDIEREHRELVERFRREDEERLQANREQWMEREKALPSWLRERLEHFRAVGGHDFEREGWGYELAICELAALYSPDDDFADNDRVMAYAKEHGTSGNQHEFAEALARRHHANPDASMAGTVSALSPITGSAFYEPVNDAR